MAKPTLVICTLLFLIKNAIFAQTAPTPKAKENYPPAKLVIGIVVDQMRYDYLYKYWDKYSEGGFKRLLKEGYNCAYTQYNYTPTYTGPGHASIYTGTTPAFHGIAGNTWYERSEDKAVYCVEDSRYKTVGDTVKYGAMSPQYLESTTIGDQLKIHFNNKSKVFGIALKDRGALLTAGMSANAAYWFDGNNGAWITSSYYMDSLPKWLTDYNKQNIPEKYLNSDWKTLLDINLYSESVADSQAYEGVFLGETIPVFPHQISKLRGTKNRFEIIKYTPFGNTLTFDLAQMVIKNEKLGTDNYPDLLSVSLSSTDYIGHKFGPQSKELEDTYIRLDKELANFLTYIDASIGKNNTLFFLTADHAAAEVPAYLNSLKIKAGVANSSNLEKSCKSLLQNLYNDTTLYLYIDNQQVYLDRDKIKTKKLDYNKVCQEIADTLKSIEGVYESIPVNELLTKPNLSHIIENVARGIHPTRSGDVAYIYKPSWFEDMPKGTTHGTSYVYDNHVPLLWWGNKIPQGKTHRTIYITDIASTISQYMGCMEPNANIGSPIIEVLK